MNINVIGVPMFFGSDRKGADLGPKALREKNIINIIAESGHEVYDCGDLCVEQISEDQKFEDHSKMKYFKQIVDVNRNLAHQVYSSIASNNFPLVIGGDHSLGLGSISGVSKHYKNIAVIWVDAHGDINTHETSPSGNVHGMPLAAAMGLGHDELTNLYFDGKKVDKKNVFIVGARDLDEGEKALVKDMNLNVYSTEDVQRLGVESVMAEIIEKIKDADIDAIHLSFDIDCIDSKFVPGTGTPVTNGMTIDEAKYVLRILMESKLVKSMDFVELNPSLDPTGNTLTLCVDLLDWTFKHLK